MANEMAELLGENFKSFVLCFVTESCIKIGNETADRLIGVGLLAKDTNLCLNLTRALRGKKEFAMKGWKERLDFAQEKERVVTKDGNKLYEIKSFILFFHLKNIYF